MRRPATFTILAAVLLLASALTGCAGSSRQTESAAVTEEQTPDRQTERVAVPREQAAESGAREQYAAARRELRAALAAGTITEEQAEERMLAMMTHITQEQAFESDMRERFTAAERELRAAVEAGRITEEQAQERMVAIRERIRQEQATERSMQEQFASAVRETRAAVEAGEISEEQAHQRLTEMLEHMAQEQAPERNMREQYAAAGRELRAAVAAGRITEEQARERLAGMRERLAVAARGAGERERATLTREQIVRIRAELAAAIEAGRITEDQARERMAGLRERMVQERTPEPVSRRPMDAPSGRQIALFNGRDLSGWEYFLTDETATMEDVWSVEDGILVCTGDPRGYLATVEEYQNFRLVVEWRWPEEPGNSGVLLRITGEPTMLPNCAEAQLRSGSAGDMYGFNGFKIGGDEERLSEISIGWSLPALERNEKEPGEWNRYEITVRGGTITVRLNGELVNEATDCDVKPGRIGLQSEGGVIHFRSVTLAPLRSR